MAKKNLIEKLEQDLSEELAGLLIAASLGPDFHSVHVGSNGPSADCEIYFGNAQVGLVEVTADRDGDYERLLKEILAEPLGEHLQLPEGYGTWSCELEKNATIRVLDADVLCPLLNIAIETGIDDVSVEDQWPEGELLNLLTELKLRSLHRISWSSSESQNYIFRHLPAEGGVIDDSPDLIADYLQSFVDKKKIISKVKKLDCRANGMTRHFCVITGSGSDYSVRFRMTGTGLVSPLPQKSIELPSEIDVLWIMSMSAGRILQFSAQLGWSEYVRPTQGSPWWHYENLESVRRMNLLSTTLNLNVSSDNE